MANKFYVHNDIFCYEDEVFGDSEAELDEGKLVLNDYRVAEESFPTDSEQFCCFDPPRIRGGG